MSFVVLYDASVLYPIRLCDFLVRVARQDIFQAKWTARILDEMTEAGIRDRPDAEAYLRKRRRLLMKALRDGEVVGYTELIDALTLPDPDDRHVLAAAIRAHAQVVVTENLRDFPPDVLAGWGIEAQNAAEFIHHAVDLAPERVARAVMEMAEITRKPPQSPLDVLDWFVLRYGMHEAALGLRRHLPPNEEWERHLASLHGD